MNAKLIAAKTLESLLGSALCLLWLGMLGCGGGGGNSLDGFFPSTAATTVVSAPSGAVFSATAFSYSPTLHDFGNQILNSVQTSSINMSNVSGSGLYIASIVTLSSHFTIASDTCPRAPIPLATGQNCILNVQFSPHTIGNLGASVLVYFGSSLAPNSPVYSSTGTALLGKSLSALSFTGLASISGETSRSLLLNWTADPIASAYLIYQIVGGNPVYVKTVNNVGGTVSGATLTGLTPATPYTYRVRAIDSLGGSETNTSDISAFTDVQGSFATASLAVAEGATASLNLTPLCTDIKGSSPSAFSLVSQTSGNAPANCIVSGTMLQCTPNYLSGHAPWTETATVNCRINESDLLQTFTIHVSDTNIPASLLAISNQSVIAGSAITPVDANGTADTQIDGDSYTYSCAYDTWVNGSVTAGSNCSTLSTTSFNSATGVFSWTPSYAEGGLTYEFMMAASDGVTSASRIFTIQVDSAVPIIAHSPAGNRVFPNNYLDQTSTLTWDFRNSRTGSDAGMAYTCIFDQDVDGIVNAGQSCSALTGTANFDTATGILTWTPGSRSWGGYEFKISGVNAAGSASEIAVVDVRQPYPLTDASVTRTLLSDLDAQFATLSGASGNTLPAAATWRDLTSNAHDGTLTNTGATAASGWAGSSGGPYTSPFRMVLDGVNDFVNLGSTVLASVSSSSFTTWVNPAAATASDKFIFGNTDGAGNGFMLRQSSLSGHAEITAGIPTYDEEVLTDTPYAYWRFGESAGSQALDSSGHGRNGYYTGSYTLSNPGALVNDSDTAVGFTHGYFEYDPVVPVSGTFSIEFWVKPNDPNMPKIIYARQPTDQGFDLGMNAVGFGGDIGTGGGWISFNLSAPATIAAGNWYHVAYVFTPTGYTGYVNGVATGSGSWGATSPLLMDSNHTLRIGAGPAENFYFSGFMDDFAVYDYSLPASRIVAHYAARNRFSCRSSSTLTSGSWYDLAAAFSPTFTKLFVNGIQECAIPSSPPLSSSPVTLGSSSGSKAWAGSVADLKLYGTDTASTSAADAKTHFDSTANRFRKTPLEDIVYDNSLVVYLDAANANQRTRAFSNGCAVTDQRMADLSPVGSDATLANFNPADCSGATADGWQGNGTPSFPYRIRFDSSNDYVTGSMPTNTFSGDFTVDSWIYHTGNSASWSGIFTAATGGAASTVNISFPPPGSTSIGMAQVGVAGGPGPYIDLGADHYNQWIYVALRRSGLNFYMDAWKNGTRISSGAINLNYSLNSSTNVYQMGVHGNTAGSFNGDIPITRIYNRYLNDAEILRNCRAQDTRFPGTTCN